MRTCIQHIAIYCQAATLPRHPSRLKRNAASIPRAQAHGSEQMPDVQFGEPGARRPGAELYPPVADPLRSLLQHTLEEDSHLQVWHQSLAVVGIVEAPE